MPPIDRRTLVRAGAGLALGAALPGCSLFSVRNRPCVRFGMVTDLHYARIPVRIGRQYACSAEKLAHVVATMNDARPDFLIELGDFKDLGPTPAETRAYLDEIEGIFRTFSGARYHVLGNHDTDCLSKEEFLSHVGESQSYYAFVVNGVTFVVLDACFTSDMKPYCRANPWTDANVPPEELAWLERTLAAASGPVVVFCHQRLDPASEPNHLVRNAAAVRTLLEKSGKVRSVFTGHQHDGGESCLNGIRYVTLKAMVTGSETPAMLVDVFSDGTARLVPLALSPVSPKSSSSEPVKVIFDTDMYTDIDDVGALACLHALANAGECEILATMVNTRECLSAAVCEIINAYYGRPDIPVGCVKGMGLGRHRPQIHETRYRPIVHKYAKWVRHENSSSAPDATEVYRQVLSAQPDHSVVICSVGFLTNLRRLVETDRDLVARKVKRWVAMACAYPKGREYNSMMDAASSRIALENWPTPIVFTDYQYGVDCFAGRAIAESSVADSPVADVFRVNKGCFNGPAGRSAWDETAVLIAVRGTERYFNTARGTYRMVGEKGDDEWIPDEANGPHLRITEKCSKADVGKIIDELMCRQPLTNN